MLEDMAPEASTINVSSGASRLSLKCSSRAPMLGFVNTSEWQSVIRLGTGTSEEFDVRDQWPFNFSSQGKFVMASCTTSKSDVSDMSDV